MSGQARRKKTADELLAIIQNNPDDSKLASLPRELQKEIFEHVFSNIIYVRDPNHICNHNWRSVTYGSSNIDACWECYNETTQLNEETKGRAFNHFILDFRSSFALHGFLGLWAPGGPNIHYLGLSELVHNRKEMVTLANQFGRIPNECPNLRAISFKYLFGGTEEEAAQCMPFKTPADIESEMLNNSRKHCHDRIMHTMIRLIDLPALHDFSFSLGGGDNWTMEQCAIWNDYFSMKWGGEGAKLVVEGL